MQQAKAYVSLLLCLTVAAPTLTPPVSAEEHEPTPASAANCTFRQDPDEFLARETRARDGVNDRVLKFSRAMRSGEGRTVPAAQIPRRNFIDDEIFGGMQALQVPSARLSSRFTLIPTGPAGS